MHEHLDIHSTSIAVAISPLYREHRDDPVASDEALWTTVDMPVEIRAHSRFRAVRRLAKIIVRESSSYRLVLQYR